MTNLINDSRRLKIDKSWSYSDKLVYDTSYLTHNYYSYPAKFIPQVASRLILENSKEGDMIVDPFMGSGTTLVEALVNNRIGVGCDINYIAYLVSKVKTTPIDSNLLEQESIAIQLDLEHRLNGSFDFYLSESLDYIPRHERIDYWFTHQQKNKLAVIYKRISEVKDVAVKNFFLVAFAQILKSCSIWLQKSIKPHRDSNKVEYDPQCLFFSRIKTMIGRNTKLTQRLSPKIIKDINACRMIHNCDARNIPCPDNAISLIVTSPPYVTSYEYADLHQLPLYWFNRLNDLKTFRKDFIGSIYKTEANEVELNSKKAVAIIERFETKKKAKEVRKYFFEMLECFKEMKRVLKKNGKVCIVIGNTCYKDTNILNHAVFIEQLSSIGFEIENLIVREISSKMLPTYRDPQNGRFAKPTDKSYKLVHPKEYIIIAKKK